jgi:hypothetical protein
MKLFNASGGFSFGGNGLGIAGILLELKKIFTFSITYKT